MTKKKAPEIQTCVCFACGAQFDSHPKLNAHLNECSPMLAWRENLMQEAQIPQTQQRIEQIRDEILMIASSHDKLRKDLNGLTPQYKPWYTSWGTWLAILLFLVMCYLIYAFYMSEMGYNIKMPAWFISAIKAIIPK